MYVIPKAGLKVPDPQRQDFIPKKGRNVPNNQYWFRRIRDGDVKEREKLPVSKNKQ